jgi:hypothetical protein
MAAACSACAGPLPPDGAYSVSVSLPPDAPRRWRICAMACSLECLARVVVSMAESRRRREERQRGQPVDIAAVMTARPVGRR